MINPIQRETERDKKRIPVLATVVAVKKGTKTILSMPALKRAKSYSGVKSKTPISGIPKRLTQY